MKDISPLEHVKQLIALAEIGLHHAYNDFDHKRYQEMLDQSVQLMGELTHTDAKWIADSVVELDGYKTPKVDVRAVVFDKQHRLLLVKEMVDGHWSLPGGWADVGYTPSEVAVKEALEEAGAIVKPKRLLAVLDKQRHHHPPGIYYIYKIFIECHLERIAESDHMETTEAGFFQPDNLPPLSLPRNTAEQIQMLFDMHSGKVNPPVFD
ncbi:MAG: NUDIX hydrolase N-terminal domain-containing protein [Bacteroidales bacterium]|nr:NUDIX hydrolase N-terminal domain-containing protein [Bacteroidales bacterium]